MRLQERAPELLRGPDGSGALAWWLNQSRALQQAGLTHVEGERLVEQWLGSDASQQLLAQLRCGESRLGQPAWLRMQVGCSQHLSGRAQHLLQATFLPRPAPCCRAGSVEGWRGPGALPVQQAGADAPAGPKPATSGDHEAAGWEFPSWRVHWPPGELDEMYDIDQDKNDSKLRELYWCAGLGGYALREGAWDCCRRWTGSYAAACAAGEQSPYSAGRVHEERERAAARQRQLPGGRFLLLAPSSASAWPETCLLCLPAAA